jgi:hypothetical protein
MAAVSKIPDYIAWGDKELSPGGRPYSEVRQAFIRWACDCACEFSPEFGCPIHDDCHEEP